MIDGQDHFSVVAALCAIVATTIYFANTLLVRKLSVAAVILCASLLLSNIGVIPQEALVYEFVSKYCVMVAVPLLIFGADLKRIFTETGRTLGAFIIASFGTVAGVFIAYGLVPIGGFAEESASVMAGGFVGGSMNFVSVSMATELDQKPDQFVRLLGAATVVALSYLVFLSVIPTTKWFQSWDSQTTATPLLHPSETHHIPEHSGITIHTLAIGLALSVAICVVGIWLATRMGARKFAMLLVTLLTLVLANVAPKRMSVLTGMSEIGMYLLYVFFAAFAASADLIGLVRTAPILLVFGYLIVACHFLVGFGVGRLLGISAREMVIASNACILGPSTAAAMASKEGWNNLVTPGVLCGVLGYAAGTFLGVLIFHVLT